jgi:NAD(P)-dependent dehydrogenase (short-subunit alcohol dehydrogenase family)
LSNASTFKQRSRDEYFYELFEDDRLAVRHDHQRRPQPADVVQVVRFLAAPETRWAAAQTIDVNGGMISPIN